MHKRLRDRDPHFSKTLNTFPTVTLSLDFIDFGYVYDADLVCVKVRYCQKRESKPWRHRRVEIVSYDDYRPGSANTFRLDDRAHTLGNLSGSYVEGDKART